MDIQSWDDPITERPDPPTYREMFPEVDPNDYGCPEDLGDAVFDQYFDDLVVIMGQVGLTATETSRILEQATDGLWRERNA